MGEDGGEGEGTDTTLPSIHLEQNPFFFLFFFSFFVDRPTLDESEQMRLLRFGAKQAFN